MHDRKLHLVLASASPRRRALLKQIGLRFKVIPSNIKELINKDLSPAVNVKQLAFKKASEVAKRLKEGIVIGADTVVILDGMIINKPKSKAEAKKMLRMLSDRIHTVYTGCSLIDVRSGKHIEFVEKTKVKFRKLEDSEIDLYVRTGAPLDKAGAYGIQDDFGAVFIEKIEGCYYNVVGFPLARFYTIYRKFIKSLERK